MDFNFFQGFLEIISLLSSTISQCHLKILKDLVLVFLTQLLQTVLLNTTSKISIKIIKYCLLSRSKINKIFDVSNLLYLLFLLLRLLRESPMNRMWNSLYVYCSICGKETSKKVRWKLVDKNFFLLLLLISRFPVCWTQEYEIRRVGELKVKSSF